MGVLAYNLLYMIRQFYVWGEEVKRSMEWLIKRLIKVATRVSYHEAVAKGFLLFPRFYGEKQG